MLCSRAVVQLARGQGESMLVGWVGARDLESRPHPRAPTSVHSDPTSHPPARSTHSGCTVQSSVCVGNTFLESRGGNVIQSWKGALKRLEVIVVAVTVQSKGLRSVKVVPFVVATPIGCAAICLKTTTTGPKCFTTLSVIVPPPPPPTVDSAGSGLSVARTASTVAQKLGKNSGIRTLFSVFFMVCESEEELTMNYEL